MLRLAVARFMVGDEVRHPDGREGVIVLSYPRRSDRRQFPMVKVLKGHGNREWPTSWTPVLDYDGENRIQNRCQDEDCQRLFMAPGTFGLCRQCKRRKDAEQAAEFRQRSRGGTVNAERDALERPWRLLEQIPALTTTTAVAEPEHPADCLCGMTSKCTPF